MYLYLFAILLFYIGWRVKDYFYKEVKNFSKTSTPIIKSSFYLAYQSQGSIAKKIFSKSENETKTFFVPLQRKYSNFHANVPISSKRRTFTGSSVSGRSKCVGQKRWNNCSDHRNTPKRVTSTIY